MSKIDDLIAKMCPDGVPRVELSSLIDLLNGYSFKSNLYSLEGIRVIRITNVQKGFIDNSDSKFYPMSFKQEISKYLLKTDDLLVSLTGNVGRVAQVEDSLLPAGLNQRVASLRVNDPGKVRVRFLYHLLNSSNFEMACLGAAFGSAQANLSTEWLKKYLIPLPPLEIQKEIVAILDKFTELEAELEAELKLRKKQYLSHLEHFIPSSNTDDFEFLNKNKDDTGNSVFGLALDGLTKFLISDLIDYEQPTKYLVSSKEYDDTYPTPVLTAGETFLLGYTSEVYGKYPSSKNSPVIIFDDFTTSTKWVDFEFKVKSSAMKMLTVKKDAPILLRYFWYVINSIKIETSEHARYWISKISRLEVFIPSIEIQKKIVSRLDLHTNLEADLVTELEFRRKQYEYYRNKLLTFKELDVA